MPVRPLGVGPVAPGQPYAPKDYRPPVRADEIYANEFGVASDGTDQTNNLTRALTHAVAQGKTLVIPPGTIYALNVQVPAGASIRGFGASSILRRPSTGVGGLSNILRVTGSDTTISDLTLDGNKAGLAMADNRGVIDASLADIDDIVIENCTIFDGAEKGIRFVNHGSGLSILGCTIRDCDEEAIVVQQTTQDGSDLVVVGCDVSSSVAAAAGIYCRGSDDGVTYFQRRVTIANNRVVLPLAGTGLCIEQWCEDCIISGNVTDGGSFGISNGPGARTSITGNTIRRADGIGLEASAADSSYTTCTGNVVDCDHVTNTGISISETVLSVVVTGNIVRYPVGNAGIHMNETDRAILSDNIVIVDATTDATPYGIRVQGCDNLVCTGNQVDGTTPNAGLGDNGISFNDVTNLTATGNLIKNHTYGFRFVSSSAVYVGTIVGNTLVGCTDPYNEVLSGTASTAGLVFGSNAPTIP